MEQHLAQDINEKDRWQFLCDNADAVEKIGYTHRFTPEELAQKKESLAEVSITINDIETEKKEVMEEFKERLKPLNEEKPNCSTTSSVVRSFAPMKSAPRYSTMMNAWRDSITS